MDPVIVIGTGLAGLVTAYELLQRNVPVLLLDQENEANLGGQAFWSFGGIFLVDSAAQRRLGVRDSVDLAWRDWQGSAQFDRHEDEDYWAQRWARAFVTFAADELEAYLSGLGIRFMFSVGWAERGDGRADGHGNSVPRFHIVWGSGPEIVRVFAEPLAAAAAADQAKTNDTANGSGIHSTTETGTTDNGTTDNVSLDPANSASSAAPPDSTATVAFRFRHRVDQLIVENGRVVGVRGQILAPDASPRGVASNREEVRPFAFRASHVVVASGGIGGNVDLVRAAWPAERFGGRVPKRFVCGVPAHVDGRMLAISETAGARVVNRDRMWHYTEGLQNWDPIWPQHGIRILPAPSSLWLDAYGKRFPPFLFPGSDTLATLRHICETGHDYSWFLLNQTIIAREFALSGSEQNPDITKKSYWQLFTSRYLSRRGTQPVQNFQDRGVDFVVAEDVDALVHGMNQIIRRENAAASGEHGAQADAEAYGVELDVETVREAVAARDAQMENAYAKDAQAMLIRNARQYAVDRWVRVAPPHRLTDPSHGPLIAIRLNLLTRKTLGGLQTDLDGRVTTKSQEPGRLSETGGRATETASPKDRLNSRLTDTQNESTAKDRTGISDHPPPPFQVLPGLYAVGEVAGFGGGGVHGYNALEGSFLGGCIFSGKRAAEAIARDFRTKEIRDLGTDM